MHTIHKIKCDLFLKFEYMEKSLGLYSYIAQCLLSMHKALGSVPKVTYTKE